tara:strand:- start:1334 stop:1741 length:408 start_codon:yes stop_codon:yes gene_type:complete
MGSVFISRGVVEKAVIKATKRFPEITFSYTPAMVEQRAGLIGDMGKTDDVARKERLSAKLCAELISEWCFEEEVTAGNLLRMHPEVFNKFCDIVCFGGEDESDPRDREPEQEEAALESALDGNYADKLMEIREGN